MPRLAFPPRYKYRFASGLPRSSRNHRVYRIIYQIDDSQQTITVVDIGHRRDIYR